MKLSDIPWKVCIWDPKDFKYVSKFSYSSHLEFQEMWRYTMGDRVYLAVRVYVAGPFKEVYLVECNDLSTYSRGEIISLSEYLH